jgi:hypothetical protein
MTQATERYEEAAQLRSLDEAFKWAIKRVPRLEPEDVVIQDEYTHDVLFRVHDNSYLAFDTS